TAGIVAGPAQWQDRLRRHSRSVLQRREALERREDAPEGQIRGLTVELDHAQRLASFIAELTASVQPERGWNWAEFAGWARKLLEQYLGGEGHRRDWPEHEVEAYRKIEGVLETLAHLDDVRPQTDESTFRRALERELEAPASRIGRFGDGVFTGRIRDAMGTSFDVVILLGMSEGLVPPRGRDDPLLPDSERRAAGEGIPLRTDRRAEDRRDYLAALAVAPERLLVYPRADLRGQRAKLPARWLLESASALAGQRLYSADLDKRPSPAWLTIVPSFEGALAADGAPASSQEYGLRSLLRWKRDGRQIAGHYLAVADGASALRNGFDAGLARLSSRLTRWDGSIGEAGDLMPTADRAISPTALQNWAACPRKYLLGNVLHIAETLSPEETLRISPIDRGNLLHTALERFIREMLPVQEDQPWTEDQRLRLRQIGAELCDEAEASGSTGKPVLWRLDRERIMRDLEGFLDADEELRREFGVVPWDAEFAFGVQDSDRPPVIADLDATRKIAFRGRIDRVDRAPDGSRLLVLDYKSGSALPFGNLDKDPIKSGTLLQLPIYALAAQQAHGQVPTDSYYWFATEQWDYKRAGYPVTEERLERFRSALVTIVDGIGAGLFPARPGPAQQGTYVNCMFCPYTRVCPSDKARAWERKRGAPELAQYVTLSDGGPDE
ncbi:MAG: PD-(D/E)XK nuclease family protein, partial [Chloroflexi bacterium]|nr:PD-(D/E)XK nuclease family protein [Chloroflexota bacterium]